MEKYKKLVSNTVVFTIGNFGSKIINLLMVPLYTHLLLPSEYGSVDLINTTISLLLPFLTLELGKSALRFVIEAKSETIKNQILNVISTHAIIVTILLLFCLPLLNYFDTFGSYNVLFVVYLLLSIYNNLYSQYIRGLGLVKEFALNGILMTIVTVVSNIILLVYLNYKVEGYILSLIIAGLISNLYLFYSIRGIKRIKNSKFDKKSYLNMLSFSVPIVPSAALWWVINGSTKFIVLFFIGATGNGLYAVASKIPSIISMMTNIFNQAWQLSSYEEYDSDDKDIFYSKIFSLSWGILFISGSAILVILKPLLSIIVASSFYDSWKIVPFLILGVIFENFSGFFGTIYQASKETKGFFLTSIYAGLASVIFSFVLVPSIGAMGAGISTAISFLILFLVRLRDTQKYVKIKIDIFKFITTNLLFTVQIILLFILDGVQLLLFEMIVFVALFTINKKIIIIFTKFIQNLINSRKKNNKK